MISFAAAPAPVVLAAPSVADGAVRKGGDMKAFVARARGGAAPLVIMHDASLTRC
jgi:hypothetical protein